MQQGSTTRRPATASILAIAGGAVMALGSFLDWVKVSVAGFEGTPPTKGTDGSDGWVTLVAGLALAVCGLVWLAGAARRALAIIAILAALAGGGLGLYDALTAEHRVIDEAASQISSTLQVPEEQARAVLVEAANAGALDVSIRLGLLLVVVGGVVGVGAGILALAGGRAGPSVQGAAVTPGAAPETTT